MEREGGSRTGDVLAGILELLDHLDDDRALTPDTERLALAGAAIQAADRLRTLAALLVAETRAHDSDISATGLPIVSWLADTRRMTRPQANALLHDGRDLAALPLLRAAAEAGQVSPAQARAISRVLADLPDDLDIESRHRAEATMVGYGVSSTPAGCPPSPSTCSR